MMSIAVNAQLNIDFVHQYDSPEPSTVWAVDKDNSGNVYSAGRFKTQVDLDPGAGVNNQSTIGPYDLFDMFITKTNASGVVLWSYVLGSERTDYIGDIKTDGNGDVYVTGRFSGTMDFDPGVGTQNFTASDVYDCFVLKLSSTGTFVWVEIFSGVGAVKGEALGVDSNNDVIVAGTFDGTCQNGATTLNTNGSADVFVSKISNGGTTSYLQQIGGAEVDMVKAVTGSGTDVYVGGMYSGTSNISTSGVNNVTSAGGLDCYVTKIDAAGNTIWSNAFGGPGGDEELNAIGVFANGDIAIGGRFFTTVDFDPGAGVANSTAIGTADAYVTKLSSGGLFLWNYSYGGIRTDNVLSIDVSAANTVFVGGWFNDLVDFDAGGGVVNLTSTSGNIDSYVLQITTGGTYVDVDQLDASSDVIIRSISLNGNDVVISGSMSGTADFDFNAGINNLNNSVFSGNGFVAHYNY